jgi:hypothetical protein
LTGNLLSFIGISHSLPTTAYIKMNDIWMLFAMMYPFAEVTLHAARETIKKRLGEPEEETQSA